jgi:hypothetical protein
MRPKHVISLFFVMATLLCAAFTATTPAASLDNGVCSPHALRTAIAFPSTSTVTFAACHASLPGEGDPLIVASTDVSLMTPKLHIHTTPTTLSTTLDRPFIRPKQAVQPDHLYEDLDALLRRRLSLHRWVESACRDFMPGIDRELVLFDAVISEKHDLFASWSSTGVKDSMVRV